MFVRRGMDRSGLLLFGGVKNIGSEVIQVDTTAIQEAPKPNAARFIVSSLKTVCPRLIFVHRKNLHAIVLFSHPLKKLGFFSMDNYLRWSRKIVLERQSTPVVRYRRVFNGFSWFWR